MELHLIQLCLAICLTGGALAVRPQLTTEELSPNPPKGHENTTGPNTASLSKGIEKSAGKDGSEDVGKDRSEDGSNATSPGKSMWNYAAKFGGTTKEKLTFSPGQPPKGFRISQMVDLHPGVIIEGATNGSKYVYGRLTSVEENGKSTPVTGGTKQSITKKWAALIKASKKDKANYTITVDLNYHTKDSATWASVLLGIVPAFLSLLVSTCLCPCFVWRLCSKSVLSVDSEPSSQGSEPESDSQESAQQESQPEASPPKDTETTNTIQAMAAIHAVPHLKPSWLTTVLDARVTQLSMILFSFSLLIRQCTGLFHVKDLVLQDPITAVLELSFPALKVALCLSAVVGMKAAARCKLIQQGSTAPEDLLETMHKELRWFVLLPFLPKLMMFLLPPALFIIPDDAILGFFAGSTYSYGFSEVDIMDILCHHVLLPLMTLRFMLEAFIAARVAVSYVHAASKPLKDFPQDESQQETKKELMRQVHSSCVQLGTRTLPHLSIISAPTFSIVVLNWIFAFDVMFEALLSGASNIWFARLLIAVVMIGHLPIGLACLLLPARVSDACTRLLRLLNKIRENPDAENLRDQIRMTELYVNALNNGQGIGFMLYPTNIIVSNRFIVEMTLKIAGLASIALPMLSKIFQAQRDSEAMLFVNQTS
eukprot:Skav203554  [mRNA]  locus=scaffold3576:84965:86923:+ [translate_table: standard]